MFILSNIITNHRTSLPDALDVGSLQVLYGMREFKKLNKYSSDTFSIFVSVVHGTNGSPTATSEYEHSSIPATVKKLFDLPSSFLTRRDEWAGTFEAVLQKRTEPRTDCPGYYFRHHCLHELIFCKKINQFNLMFLNVWRTFCINFFCLMCSSTTNAGDYQRTWGQWRSKAEWIPTGTRATRISAEWGPPTDKPSRENPETNGRQRRHRLHT